MSGRALVIAHRGACGYLPEHTLEAKALAYGFGVDFLEQDVVATRDGELVVLHDLHLDDVTDVAQRFSGRARADGRHYVIDFTLAELRALTVVERRRAGSFERLYSGRFKADGAHFRIATLEEELALLRGLNATTGRNVGLYPEIKHPRWHREHGIDLARRLLEQLVAAGYRHAADACYVQCFDAEELRRVRRDLGSELRLVQLVDAHDEAHAELRPSSESYMWESRTTTTTDMTRMVKPRGFGRRYRGPCSRMSPRAVAGFLCP
jgi:glycerophosphoryl diester phosphodiesterase